MLSCRNLSKAFSTPDQNTRIFSNFNLELKAGELTVLVGPNGTGKSTLMKLITGEENLDRGEIRLNDTLLSTLDASTRMRYISLIQQKPESGTVGSMTILENLALAESKHAPTPFMPLIPFRRERTCQLRQTYALHLKRLGMGLEHRLDQKVSTLSGGQRQALSLIMAIMSPGRLLLLDEHTAALDPKTSEVVLRLTEQFVKEENLTALMITHDLADAARFGNRVIMLANGQAHLDISGQEKKALLPKDLMERFIEFSVPHS